MDTVGGSKHECMHLNQQASLAHATVLPGFFFQYEVSFIISHVNK